MKKSMKILNLNKLDYPYLTNRFSSMKGLIFFLYQQLYININETIFPKSLKVVSFFVFGIRIRTIKYRNEHSNHFQNCQVFCNLDMSGFSFYYIFQYIQKQLLLNYYKNRNCIYNNILF